MKVPLVSEFVFKHHTASSICHPAKINSDALGRLAIFPKIGVLYNRVKKNANSTTVVALSALEDGVLSHTKSAKRGAVQWHHLQTQFMNFDEFKRLLIIRDPYSRTLSAFREKFRQDKYKQRWREFELSPQGFLEFLHWLKDGALSGDAHWDLQMKSIAFPLESYSHVLRFEHLEGTLFEFLKQCSATTSEEIFLESKRRGSQHATGSCGALEQFYGKESLRLVSEMFEKDFSFLDYPFRS